MSRRSRKRKRHQQQEKCRQQKANEKPLGNDAMKQALKSALDETGESLPDSSSKSFSSAVQDIRRKLFGGRKQENRLRRPPKPRGADTQFIKRTGVGDVELVIGLDFGTSCTKVVIQDIATGTGYAVPFAPSMNDQGSYLLPTIVSLDDQHIFNLERHGKDFRGLKENLMRIAAVSPSSHDDKARALMPHTIAYLALMFREIRAWFMEEHEKDYQGRELKWRINVGLPASRFDTRHMPVFYRSTVRKAWYLSTINEPITADSASEVWTGNLPEDDRDAALPPDSIAAFPEVVAAVQGYVKSPEGKKGIHLLVDVGASTLDVTCFRYQTLDHEDRYPIFFASVRRLGGFELFRHRAGVVRGLVNSAIDQFTEKMDGTTEPENLLKLKFGLDREEQLQEDNDFSNEVGIAIWNVIAQTKSKKVRMAREWTSKLPTFLCGGACGIDLYSQALRRIDENEGWLGSLERKELILPKNVEAPGITPAIRQRLMVAYGLSFNQFDIGTLIPPSGIPEPDAETDRKQFTDAFISKDMV
jgi:hypothetical protein